MLWGWTEFAGGDEKGQGLRACIYIYIYVYILMYAGGLGCRTGRGRGVCGGSAFSFLPTFIDPVCVPCMVVAVDVGI